MTPDITYGGQFANAYIDRVYAEDFLTTNVFEFELWIQAPESECQIAIFRATRDIDSMIWNGTRYFSYQALEFPRILCGSTSPGGGTSFPDPTFPDLVAQDNYQREMFRRVQEANALQAFHVLRIRGRYLEREALQTGAGSTGINAAGVSDSASFARQAIPLCAEALDRLVQYRGMPRLYRGS